MFPCAGFTDPEGRFVLLSTEGYEFHEEEEHPQASHCRPPFRDHRAARDQPSVTSQTVTAGKPESVVVAKATPEVSSKATKTEVSPTTDSNPAVSAVTMTAPADAVEKMPAEQSADSVMANTTPTAALVNSLRDTSADVASEAAAALGATGDHSAVKPLSDVIANADGYYHPVVRAAAATSLGKLGDTKAVPALIAGIRDEMAEASAESIRALAAIGDARAVAAG